MPDHHGLFEPERLGEPIQVCRLGRQVVPLVGPVAECVPTLVVSGHAELLREQWRHEIPDTQCRSQPMHQHQRRPTRAPLPVIEPYPCTWRHYTLVNHQTPNLSSYELLILNAKF